MTSAGVGLMNTNEEYWQRLLEALEVLAAEWEQRGDTAAENENKALAMGTKPLAEQYRAVARANWDAAEELRSAISAYFEAGMRVSYFYASMRRTGTLLAGPRAGEPRWQVQRDGFGGWVDQADPSSIRILVEHTVGGS
jgi:hypothetical protein